MLHLARQKNWHTHQTPLGWQIKGVIDDVNRRMSTKYLDCFTDPGAGGTIRMMLLLPSLSIVIHSVAVAAPLNMCVHACRYAHGLQ